MLLLDTHALLWFLDDSPILSATAVEAIRTNSDVRVSIASLWEIAIKSSLGKLQINRTISEMANECRRSSIGVVPIMPVHLDVIKALPDIHKDPFDRLIISMAIYEDATLVTRDDHIAKYPVKTVW